MDLENQTLKELFSIADKIGKKRYNRLTEKDTQDYEQYACWRYIDGEFKNNTTQESKDWVRENSDDLCPICNCSYSRDNYKTIDHKLPRSKYPWLSMEFKNMWVICHECNKEKGEMDWYDYERYMYLNHRKFYLNLRMFRPTKLLQSLNVNQEPT